MKKVVIALLLLLFMLFILPVRADISLTSPLKTVYNAGDQLLLQGFFVEHETLDGLMKVTLVCQDEQELLVKPLHMEKDVKKDFTEQVFVPSSITGMCVAKITLVVANATYDQFTSNSFELSHNLVGTFTLNKDMLQLGDTITITGDVQTFDGRTINGFATIALEKDHSPFFVDSVTITNGHLTYQLHPANVQEGIFNVTLAIKDALGNEKIFSAGELQVVTSINLYASSSKIHVKPGEKFILSGEARDIHGPLEEGIIDILYDNQTITTEVKKGLFEQSLLVQPHTKSGTKIIHVNVHDAPGNTGTTDVSLIVDQVPTLIQIATDKEEYQPNDNVFVTATLLDQGGYVITQDLTLQLFDAEDTKIVTDVVVSSNQVKYLLKEDAVPGTWTIKVRAQDVAQEKHFYVNVFTNLLYAIAGNDLVITNNGNSNFDGSVKIVLQGFEKTTTLVKDTSLGVHEEKKIDLGKGIQGGTYDVIIGDQTFNNVTIKGKWNLSFGWFVYVVAIVFFIFVVYLLGQMNKMRKRRIKFTPEQHHVRHDIIVGPKRKMIEEKKPLKFKIKKSESDYRFTDTKNVGRDNSGFIFKRRDKPSEKSGGMFDMFQ